MADHQAARALGATIRRLRVDRGLTQQQVAVPLGMSRSHYSNLESGRGMASLVRLRALCRVLGVALDDLVDAAWPDERALAGGEHLRLETARVWTFGEHILALGTPLDDRRTVVLRCYCDQHAIWTRQIERGLLAGRSIASDANLVIAIARHIAEAHEEAARRLRDEGFLNALGNRQDLIALLDTVADAVDVREHG